MLGEMLGAFFRLDNFAHQPPKFIVLRLIQHAIHVQIEIGEFPAQHVAVFGRVTDTIVFAMENTEQVFVE